MKQVKVAVQLTLDVTPSVAEADVADRIRSLIDAMFKRYGLAVVVTATVIESTPVPGVDAWFDRRDVQRRRLPRRRHRRRARRPGRHRPRRAAGGTGGAQVTLAPCPRCARAITRYPGRPPAAPRFAAHKCPHGCWCNRNVACKRCREERDGEPAPTRPTASADSHDAARAAGLQRADGARAHLAAVQEDLQAAMQDLCSLIHGNEAFRILQRAENDVRHVRELIDADAADQGTRLFRLDYPDAREHAHAGCGGRGCAKAAP